MKEEHQLTVAATLNNYVFICLLSSSFEGSIAVVDKLVSNGANCKNFGAGDLSYVALYVQCYAH